MKINEIFYSIQGEGKWSGFPNIFIRTTGCNLDAHFVIQNMHIKME